MAPTDIAIRWILSTFPSLESSLDITPEGVMLFSRQFSLFMVGIIVLSSVRLVLRGVNQVCILFPTVFALFTPMNLTSVRTRHCR